MDIQSKTVGLVVNAPEIFLRADFRAWLNNTNNSIFTWHKRGDVPSDTSDVMVLIDSNYEGDSSDMPSDIWNSLCDLAYAEYCGGLSTIPSAISSHITLRLTNLT